MVVEHLEAYEIALIIWSVLLGLIGLQGLISIYLEGEVEEVGVYAPSTPPWKLIALMAALTGAVVWTAWALMQQIVQGSAAGALGPLAATMAFLLAALVGLYRRYFIADEVIAQQRDDGVPW